MSIFLCGSGDVNTLDLGWSGGASVNIDLNTGKAIQITHARVDVRVEVDHDGHGGEGGGLLGTGIGASLGVNVGIGAGAHISGGARVEDKLVLTGNFGAGLSGTIDNCADISAEGQVRFAVFGASADARTAVMAGAQASATLLAGDDTLFGGSGNDVICGFGGNNFLVAGTGKAVLMAGHGSDTLCGGVGDTVMILGDGHAKIDLVTMALAGAGRDVFCAAADEGLEAIFHFKAGVDVLQIANGTNGIHSVADIKAHIIADAHGNSFVDLGHGNFVGLIGVSASSLTDACFSVA